MAAPKSRRPVRYTLRWAVALSVRDVQRVKQAAEALGHHVVGANEDGDPQRGCARAPGGAAAFAAVRAKGEA